MLTKLDNSTKYGKLHRGFGLEILYPGLIRPQLNDSGLYTLGRMDHARILPGRLIPMHPHRDDEILTYLRSGSVEHRDSEGHAAIISSRNLMVMNAGTNFYHEERVREETGVLEGLQIFIRPELSGLIPQVQFHALAEEYSSDQWRKLAGREADYPLQLRSDTAILDMRLTAGRRAQMPAAPDENTVFLLYVFQGSVSVGSALKLVKGESALLENDSFPITAHTTTDLVVFLTRTDAIHFDAGMYSGNIQD